MTRRRDLEPVAAAVSEAISLLEALDALSPRLKNLLRAAVTIVNGQVLLRNSRERADRIAALEAAIKAQDEKLETKK